MLDGEGNVAATYYAVVFAVECDADAQPHRDRLPKIAPQRGTSSLIAIGPDLDFEDTTDATEQDPGGIVVRNDDDDDPPQGNDVRDRDEPHTTRPAAEDDFRQLTLSQSSAGLTGVTLTLEATEGRERVRLWSQDAGPPPGGDYAAFVLPATWDLDDPEVELPGVLYVEGIEGSEAPRDVTLKLTWTLAGTDWEAKDVVNATVLVIDLDADADRDGNVEDTDDDDWPEDRWDSDKGAVILNNNDDDEDNGPPVDSEDNQVNGPDDVDDLAEIHIHQILDVPLPAGWQVVLRCSMGDAQKLRVFDERGVAGQARIGPGTTEWVPPDITGHGVLTYGVEAIGYPAAANEPPVMLELALRRAGVDDLFVDHLALRRAPWMLLPNTAQTDAVYLVDVTGTEPGQRAGFIEPVRAAVGGVTLIEIPGEYYEWDRWVQDEFEIGTDKAPWRGPSSVVLNLPRNRGLDPYGADPDARDTTGALLAPDFGHFVAGNHLYNDYGGNLEVSPPRHGWGY